eukprot:6025054-Prymnesium_polylepis.1
MALTVETKPLSAAGAALTLVLGIIPSEKPRPFEWQAHADRRHAARGSWLTLRPNDVVTRFVVEAD